MRKFRLTVHGREDVCATLSYALSVCGSLSASREKWARVVEALGVKVHGYLEWKGDEEAPGLHVAGYGLVWEAVPEPEFPHPQRADYKIVPGDPGIEFVTPGGVSVYIIPVGLDSVEVTVDFGRNSCYLATMMLAGFANRCRGAYRLLAKAATELADVEFGVVAETSHETVFETNEGPFGTNLGVMLTRAGISATEL